VAHASKTLSDDVQGFLFCFALALSRIYLDDVIMPSVGKRLVGFPELDSRFGTHSHQADNFPAIRG